MEENKNTQENHQNDGGKVLKNYESTFKKLVAIVGGEENVFSPKKIAKNIVGDIVTGLLKERKENLEKEVKTELLSLLDKHVLLKKEIKAKEEELKKLSETKMKEFTDAANKVFNKIEGIGELEKEYYDSITKLDGSDGKTV